MLISFTARYQLAEQAGVRLLFWMVRFFSIQAMRLSHRMLLQHDFQQCPLLALFLPADTSKSHIPEHKLHIGRNAAPAKTKFTTSIANRKQECAADGCRLLFDIAMIIVHGPTKHDMGQFMCQG
ncbi:MAG: hypothetical protein PHN53_06020 [Eubacteriales bacterium]|nr:hypothetical protein [Eubacteriales bacterium]